MPNLSIVIPAYNEAARIGQSLIKIFEYLNQNHLSAELIVVDDGSQDDTVSVAAAAFQTAGDVTTKLISVDPNRGKGHAVRVGLLAANAPIALFSDADLSTPITELPKVITPIEHGDFDLVFGSRALDRRLIGVHQSWRREIGGRVFNQVVRLATGLPFSDTQCGFKGFRMSACRPIIKAATIDRFAFDVELLYIAQLAGLRLSEVPVVWNHFDGSKVSMLRDSCRMFVEVQATRSRRQQYLRSIGAASKQQADDAAPSGVAI